jgi:hypothetical protein
MLYPYRRKSSDNFQYEITTRTQHGIPDKGVNLINFEYSLEDAVSYQVFEEGRNPACESARNMEGHRGTPTQ